MSKDRLDRLIEATFENDISGLKGLDDISIPDENYIMQKFRSSIDGKAFAISTPQKIISISTNRSILRTVITAASLAFIILVSSSVFSILFGTSNIKAIKQSIVRTFMQLKDDALNITFSSENTTDDTNKVKPSGLPSSEIDEGTSEKLSMDELMKKIKFPIIIPNYLPDGYVMKDIQLDILPSGTNVVAQTYTNPDNNYLVILQSTNAYNITGQAKAPETAKVTTTTILGMKAQIISSNDFIHQIIWFNNGYEYHIIARISEKELDKFISNLKFSN